MRERERERERASQSNRKRGRRSSGAEQIDVGKSNLSDLVVSGSLRLSLPPLFYLHPRELVYLGSFSKFSCDLCKRQKRHGPWELKWEEFT